MNERIRDLYRQAVVDYGFDYLPTPTLERFAELIVQECAEVLRKEMDRLDTLDRVVSAQTLDTAQVLIKNHFGVDK